MNEKPIFQNNLSLFLTLTKSISRAQRISRSIQTHLQCTKSHDPIQLLSLKQNPRPHEFAKCTRNEEKHNAEGTELLLEHSSFTAGWWLLNHGNLSTWGLL